MRVKREYRTASKANYNRFKAANPTVKVTFDQFKKVIKECNKMIYTHALETGEKVKLPYGFGEIGVHKYKGKSSYYVDKNGEQKPRLPIDFKKTREEGVTVYNMNFHTSGYRFKWRLFNNSVRLYQSQVWVFKPSRYMSRDLAKYIFSDPYYSQLYRTW